MAYTSHIMHVFKPSWMHAERQHHGMDASEDPELLSEIEGFPQDCCSNAEHFCPTLASCLTE